VPLQISEELKLRRILQTIQAARTFTGANNKSATDLGLFFHPGYCGITTEAVRAATLKGVFCTLMDNLAHHNAERH
jgi:hypothetical protein